MAHNRVVQWATMANAWWLYDASNQCAFRSAYRLVAYLRGMHKPIFYSSGEAGDHVVVYNTRHIAMRGNYWRTFKHHHHTRYAGGYSRASAWRVHEMDPTRVLEKAVYSRMAGLESRRPIMCRLHLFPDDEIPENILNNITGQIQQVQVIPKRLQDYTQEEIDNFPRMFELPQDYDVDLFKRQNRLEPDQHTLKKWRIK